MLVIYHAMFTSATTGDASIRPVLYYQHSDPAVRDESFVVSVGPSLIVACALDAGCSCVEVAVPSDENGWELVFEPLEEPNCDREQAGPAEHLNSFDGYLPHGRRVRLPAPLASPPPMIIRTPSVIPVIPIVRMKNGAPSLRQFLLDPSRYHSTGLEISLYVCAPPLLTQPLALSKSPSPEMEFDVEDIIIPLLALLGLSASTSGDRRAVTT